MTQITLPHWFSTITRFAHWLAQLWPYSTISLPARKARSLLAQLEVIECGIVMTIVEALRKAPETEPAAKPEKPPAPKRAPQPRTQKPQDPQAAPAFRIPRSALDMLGLYDPPERTARKPPAGSRCWPRRAGHDHRFNKILARRDACLAMLLDPKPLIGRLARKLKRAARPVILAPEGTREERLEAFIEAYARSTGAPAEKVRQALRDTLRPPDG